MPERPIRYRDLRFSVKQTTLSVSDTTLLNGITFKVGASAFTFTSIPSFTAYLNFSGVGIVNSSGIVQNFVGGDIGGTSIIFTNASAAGILTAFTGNGGTVNNGSGGGVAFYRRRSTADHGTFTTNGGAVIGANGGRVHFFDTSTAGTGTFINNGVSVSAAALHIFNDTSDAGNASFTNNGGMVCCGGGGTLF